MNSTLESFFTLLVVHSTVPRDENTVRKNYSMRAQLPVPKFKIGGGTIVHIAKITSYQKKPNHQKYLLKISKFTKFGLVLLHSNRPVSCQSLPKFHTNHSNSEIASPKSIQSL